MSRARAGEQNGKSGELLSVFVPLSAGSVRCYPGPRSQSRSEIDIWRCVEPGLPVYREAESETLFMFVGSRIRKHGMREKLEQGHVIL